MGCAGPFSRFLCEETAVSCCFHSKKHFCANHFQAVVNVPISLTFVRNSNLSGQKRTSARLVCVRVVRHFLIPLFRYSAIPLFRYSVIPLFRYSAIPLFRYSVIPLFRIPRFGNAAVDANLLNFLIKTLQKLYTPHNDLLVLWSMLIGEVANGMTSTTATCNHIYGQM